MGEVIKGVSGGKPLAPDVTNTYGANSLNTFDKEVHQDLQNISETVLPMATRNATTESGTIYWYNGYVALFVFNITAVPGNDTVQFVLEAIDPVTGDVCTYAAADATQYAGKYLYAFIPGGGSYKGSVTTVWAIPLPMMFKVKIVHSASTNFTYSVAATLYAR